MKQPNLSGKCITITCAFCKKAIAGFDFLGKKFDPKALGETIHDVLSNHPCTLPIKE